MSLEKEPLEAFNLNTVGQIPPAGQPEPYQLSPEEQAVLKAEWDFWKPFLGERSEHKPVAFNGDVLLKLD